MTISAPEGQDGYSCKCLNVRVLPLTPSSASPPPKVDDDNFTPLFVGEEGITVAHVQLTLRTRSAPIPQTTSATSDEQKSLTRNISLTCLICQVLVYRVRQTITEDIASTEGPFLPTEDWAEDQLLKSPSGWIEVRKDCLTGDAIHQLESSPSYSQTYHVTLPSSNAVQAFATPTQSFELPKDDKKEDEEKKPEPKTILPSFPPLFLPPPFTPQHVIFSHLTSIAETRSTKIREEAEEALAQIVQQKAKEVKEADEILRREVELLWHCFRESLARAHGPELTRHRSPTRRQSGTRSVSTNQPFTSLANGVPASIRVSNFVPVASPPRRSSSIAAHPAHASALSASLVTSSFHHPRALAELESRTNGRTASSSPIRVPTSDTPNRTSPRIRSPATASSRTLAMNINGDSSTPIRDAYRRNMDEAKDMATSFRYVSEIESQMEEKRRQEEQAQQQAQDTVINSLPQNEAGPSTVPITRGRSPRTNKSAIKKPTLNGQSGSPSKQQRSNSRPIKEETPSKGKRKVTFDVVPDVAIITSTTAQEKPKEKVEESEGVFDFESELGGSPPANDGLSPIESLPLTPVSEGVRSPRRHPRTRPDNPLGLPASLSALRPISLPHPVSMRSPTLVSRESGTEERSRSEKIRESLVAGESTSRRGLAADAEPEEEGEAEEEEKFDLQESEILKLVAASMPSHRSAWKKNSKSWRLFKGGDSPEGNDSTAESSSSQAGYYDESEDDANDSHTDDPDMAFNAGVPQSLPIAITPLAGMKAPSNGSGVLVPPKGKDTSQSLRRVSDAVRGLKGSVALEVPAEEDEDEDEDDELPDDVGGLARQRALKIMQARDKLPPAGMWRSLA